MNKTKILKTIILGIIVFLLGITQMTNVNAASYDVNNIAGGNIGDTTTVTKGKLKASSSLYCIQHKSAWPNGTYKITDIIEIQGNKATLTTKNGKSKEYESTANGKLAYILADASGGKYGYNSERQKELWAYFNTWYKYSGTVLGLRDLSWSKNTTSVNATLDKAATQYANSGASSASIKIDGASNITVNQNGLIGPINISKSGTISSISINDKILGPNSTDFAICDQNGNVIKPNADASFPTIGNKATIYVKQLGTASANHMKIVTSATDTYKVRICVLESNNNGHQRLIAVKYSKEKTMADKEIDFSTNTTLELNKVDSRTKANLKGATFVLQHKNRFASKVEYNNGIYYVKEWSDSYYKKDAAENEKAMQELIDKGLAYQFVVGDNGLKINIPRDDSTLYALTEIKAPEGYEIGLGFVESSQVSAFVMNKDISAESSTYTDSYGIQTQKGKSTFYFDLAYKTDAKLVLSNSKKVQLIINKVDKDNVKTKLNNVEFYFKHDNLYAMADFTDTTGIWKVTGWTKYENQATKFITGDNIDDGRLVIEFAEDGTSKGNQYLYGLVEVKNPNNKYLLNPVYMEGSKNITDTKSDNDKLTFRINTSGYNSEANMTIGNITNTIITVKKVSATDTNKNIQGAEFVLKHNNSYAYAHQNSDGIWEIDDWNSVMDYTINDNKVTKFTTDKNGEIKIEVPKDGELYALVEVKAAESYGINLGYLPEQSKGVKPFDGTKSNKSWAKGINSNGIRTGKDEDTQKSISEFYFYVSDDSGAEIKVWLTNAGDTPISISGFAWIDVPNGKVNQYNNTYDSGETRLSGITVKLIENDTNKEIARTTTNSNGEYTFSNVCTYNNVQNYHVEFDYSNTDYSKYYPVTTSNSENGSRAVQLEEHMEKGKAVIYGLDNYLEKFYDSKTTTLKYMNMGIRNIIEPESSVTETLEYVKIVMNNYTYFYEYGVNGEIKGTPPTVKYQNKNISSYYSRPIYPSDILKSMKDWTNGIEVYVGYSITIKNNDNGGDQVHLDIENLVNEFDSNRYEVWNKSDGHETNNDIEVKMRGDYANWDDNGNYTNKQSHTDKQGRECPHYNVGYKQKSVIKGGTLLPGESVTKYIQFKVKNNAIEEILNNPNGIEEQNPTKAIASGSYYRTSSFSHVVGMKTCTGTSHRNTGYSGEDSAPYLVFSLGTERKVSGTVFNDTVKTSNLSEEKILGDGRYNSDKADDDDDKDYPVENVKVELMPGNTGYNYQTAQEETTPALVYYTSDDDSTKLGVPAVTTTDSNGNFTISGINPGVYYLKFTYPNGDTKIMDSNGTMVKQNDYKSTIVKSDIVRKQLLASTNSKDINGDVQVDTGWYRHIEGDNYSVAVDNLSRRSEFNSAYWNYVYNNGQEPTTNMYATTPIFEIKVENFDLDSGKNRLNGETAVNEWNYSGFNFGIIKQAKQLATIQKVISNVKLEHDPQVIFDGNPESGLPGVTDLDNKNHTRKVSKYKVYDVKDMENNKGSTYLRVEVAEDSLYGSNLTLTYDLRVQNESEVNYYEKDEKYYGWYYMFGDVINNITVPVEMSTIVDDYLDSLLEFTGNTNNATREKNSEEIKSTDGKTTIGYRYGLSYNNQIKRTETETVVLQAHKLLSELEQEWNYNNGAKIRTLQNQTSSSDKNSKTSIGLVVTPVNSPASNSKVGDDFESFTNTIITTPTGADKLSIILYIITGTIGLAVLFGGIVFIKKRIIK